MGQSTMTLTHDTVVANVTSLIESSDDTLVGKARTESDWYRVVNVFAHGLASEYGISHEKACGLLAVYSINTTWKANQTLAVGALGGRVVGLPLVVGKATKILALSNDATLDDVLRILNGPKITRFCLNIFNPDSDDVTVDRWVYRAAIADMSKRVNRPNATDYLTIQDAFRTLAAQFKMAPAQFQAFIWIIVRGSGD